MVTDDVHGWIGADITYKSHLALLVTIEPEWPRADPLIAGSGRFPSSASHRDFAVNCYRFGSQLLGNCERFHRANGSIRRESLSEHLFNPMSFHTLGGLGDLILVLVDDVDAVQQILSQATGKLGEVSVGFCPTLKTFSSGGIAYRTLRRPGTG